MLREKNKWGKVRKMWGGDYRILWGGQGNSHERERPKPSLEEVRMSATLVSGESVPRGGSSYSPGPEEGVCLAWKGIAGKPVVAERGREGSRKEVIG